jgi:hypothetical protein
MLNQTAKLIIDNFSKIEKKNCHWEELVIVPHKNCGWTDRQGDF